MAFPRAVPRFIARGHRYRSSIFFGCSPGIAGKYESCWAVTSLNGVFHKTGHLLLIRLRERVFIKKMKDSAETALE
jgi:hypothetical protein